MDVKLDENGRPDTHCDHVPDVRRRIYSNGVAHIVLQCVVCGRYIPGLERNDPRRMRAFAIPPFDEALLAKWNEAFEQAWAEYRWKADEDYQKSLDERRNDYGEYLRSEQWKRKRSRRLLRDQGRCQAELDGCLGKATEVHHLTYEHCRDEPQFDLVSVCRPCHLKLSEMEGRLRESA